MKYTIHTPETAPQYVKAELSTADRQGNVDAAEHWSNCDMTKPAHSGQCATSALT